MKILTFRRLAGLAAIGGVAYIHKQRGGEWTVASVTDTLRQLWSSAVRTLAPVHAAEERAARLTETTARTPPADVPQAGSHGNAGQRNDETGRH